MKRLATTVGIDVHKRESQLCILTPEGGPTEVDSGLVPRGGRAAS